MLRVRHTVVRVPCCSAGISLVMRLRVDNAFILEMASAIAITPEASWLPPESLSKVLLLMSSTVNT